MAIIRTIKKAFNKSVYILRLCKKVKLKDIKNIYKYGFNAPRAGQTIYINPSYVKLYVNCFSREDTGKILDGDWDINSLPIASLKKFSISYRKLSENISWEDAGAYENILTVLEEKRKKDRSAGADECFDLESIKERYLKLDKLIEHLKNGGKFLSKSEMGGIREFGGILIHIGRNGETIFGGGGFHRLAIAQMLKLKEIPAQVGVVHLLALKSGKFTKFTYSTRRGVKLKM